jgi:hypothetical protein
VITGMGGAVQNRRLVADATSLSCSMTAVHLQCWLIRDAELACGNIVWCDKWTELAEIKRHAFN